MTSIRAKLLLLQAIVALAATVVPLWVSAEDSAPEAALKAAFIYNFTKFAEWPPTVPATQLRLCTVGSNSVSEALSVFDGRQSMGRTLDVTPSAKVANIQQCQLIYISDTVSSRQVNEVIQESKGQPTLTVSDREGFLDQGGMISISRNADRLRFEVDLPAINAAHLKIAAPLLRMAKTVRQ